MVIPLINIVCNVWSSGTNSLTTNCPASSSPCLHITADFMKRKPTATVCSICVPRLLLVPVKETWVSSTHYGKIMHPQYWEFFAHIKSYMRSSYSSKSALRWTVIYVSVTRNNYEMFIIFDFCIRCVLLSFDISPVKIEFAPYYCRRNKILV